MGSPEGCALKDKEKQGPVVQRLKTEMNCFFKKEKLCVLLVNSLLQPPYRVWGNYQLWWFLQSKVLFERNQNLRTQPIYAAAAKLLQSCPTLCDPIDGSPPGSPVPGILQARTLEWVAISFSNAWKWKVKVKSLSHVRLLATPWTAAYQAPPSMGFSRREYWSGLPLPSPQPMYRLHQIKDF